MLGAGCLFGFPPGCFPVTWSSRDLLFPVPVLPARFLPWLSSRGCFYPGSVKYLWLLFCVDCCPSSSLYLIGLMGGFGSCLVAPISLYILDVLANKKYIIECDFWSQKPERFFFFLGKARELVPLLFVFL
ncbi:hypothetical protein KFK09_025555 [Dendrobium nobile]|uniref:Uncharacterized protein n=1 Tax=Dendrobium nobile TaxID=94219 RepID=A0A8T3AAC1_DENNO|nr:hypothetical protein KFK09_025555 [Dendrobium nobile]